MWSVLLLGVVGGLLIGAATGNVVSTQGEPLWDVLFYGGGAAGFLAAWSVESRRAGLTGLQAGGGCLLVTIYLAAWFLGLLSLGASVAGAAALVLLLTQGPDAFVLWGVAVGTAGVLYLWWYMTRGQDLIEGWMTGRSSD